MVNRERDFGIDILKAVSIVLVMVWHINPVTGEMISSEHFLVRGAIELFYRYISLLAVPTFIAVSLFLFVSKVSAVDGYLKARLLKLLNIFLFWVAIQYAFYILITGNRPSFSLSTITAGGPDLPHVGGSVFYFLFVLIKSTILSYLFLKASKTLKAIISLIIITASCVYFAVTPLYGIPISSMSMKNFYVYVPVTYYLFKDREIFVRYRGAFLVGFILSVLFEEFVLQSFMSVYGRLSIFFGVLSFISLILSHEFGVNRPTEMLSRYSLGIFAMHKYWQYFFIVLIEWLKGGGRGFAMPLMTEKMLLFIAAVLFTLGSVYLLNKTRLRVYIS